PSSRPSACFTAQRSKYRQPEAGPEVPAAAGKDIREAATGAGQASTEAGAGTPATNATERQCGKTATSRAAPPATDAAIAAKTRTTTTEVAAETAATAEPGEAQEVRSSSDGGEPGGDARLSTGALGSTMSKSLRYCAVHVCRN